MGGCTPTTIRCQYAKPPEFDSALVIQKTKLRTDAEHQAAELEAFGDEDRFFASGQIALLLKHADDRLKLCILLGLNCGFYPSDIGSLRLRHVKRDGTPRIEKIRSKTGVPGRWSLWPETLALIDRVYTANAEGFIVRSDRGAAIATDRQNHLARLFRDLRNRVTKDAESRGGTFACPEFKFLRHTAANVIKEIAGGEVSETFLAHKELLKLQSTYTARLWGKVRSAQLLAAVRDLCGLGWTLLSYSNLLRQQSAFGECLGMLRAARQMGVQAGDAGLVAYASAGQAETSRILGDYKRSMPQHQKALRRFEAMEDARGIVWALEGIGQMFNNTGKSEVALEYFDAAAKVAGLSGDSRGLAYALKCGGDALSRLGRHELALDRVETASRLFESMGFKVGLGYALKSAGDVLRESRKADAAISKYTAACRVFESAGELRGLAYARTGLACALENLGQPDSAIRYLGRADAYFRTSRVRFGMAQAAKARCVVTGRHGLSAKRLRQLNLDSREPIA